MSDIVSLKLSLPTLPDRNVFPRGEPLHSDEMCLWSVVAFCSPWPRRTSGTYAWVTPESFEDARRARGEDTTDGVECTSKESEASVLEKSSSEELQMTKRGVSCNVNRRCVQIFFRKPSHSCRDICRSVFSWSVCSHNP